MTTITKPPGRRVRYAETLRALTPSPWALTAVVMALLYSWFVGYVLADAVDAAILGR